MLIRSSCENTWTTEAFGQVPLSAIFPNPGLGSSGSLSGRIFFFWFGFEAGQKDGEAGAFIEDRFTRDPTSVVFHRHVSGVEPESGTVFMSLG
jgi:hypothetical protein